MLTVKWGKEKNPAKKSLLLPLLPQFPGFFQKPQPFSHHLLFTDTLDQGLGALFGLRAVGLTELAHEVDEVGKKFMEVLGEHLAACPADKHFESVNFVVK